MTAGWLGAAAVAVWSQPGIGAGAEPESVDPLLQSATS